MKRPVREVTEKLGVPSRGDVLRWESFLAHVDYKPGWKLEVIDLISQKGALAVRFRMLVWDTMRKRDLVPIAVVTDYTVPPNLLGNKFSYSEACNFVRDCIGYIELHERDEWFRFDGSQVYNPHGPPQQLGRRIEGWEWMSPEALSIAPQLKEKLSG